LFVKLAETKCINIVTGVPLLRLSCSPDALVVMTTAGLLHGRLPKVGIGVTAVASRQLG
jgi:hypothetical protein